MKKFPRAIASAILLSSFCAIFLNSCRTECTQTRTYVAEVPIYKSLAEIRNSFQVMPVKALEDPGKIHVNGAILYIMDGNEGFHIVDNSDPLNPVFKKYIKSIGATDISSIGTILYVNQGPDILVLDATDLNDVRIVSRLTDIMNENLVKEDSFVVDYEKKTVIEIIEDQPCGGNGGFGGRDFALNESTNSSGGSGSIGNSGSMARFAIQDNHMYVVDNSSLTSIDMSQPASPKVTQKQSVNQMLETIFTTDEHIFLGSTTGMHIFKINQGSPVFLSSFNHARGCDPVVVDGNNAFVTLRGNGACGAAEDELHVVDITDLTNPFLNKSYEMNEPYGLGIKDNILAICDGSAGLRIFDKSNIMSIDKNELSTVKGLKTYDVIILGNHLILTAEEGIFQFDITDPKKLRQISSLFSK